MNIKQNRAKLPEDRPVVYNTTMSIYTGAGDTGETSLLAGKKVKKSSKVVEVLGNLDELNASIGLIYPFSKESLHKLLKQTQSDIFLLGAYIAGKDFKKAESEIFRKKILQMEKLIDVTDKKNKKISSFILPGGTDASVFLHFARTVCRRAERYLVDYVAEKKKKELSVTVIYLNRLSDLLFVLARANNNKGKKDIVWNKSGK